jgi:anti-sigma factor RsiW
MNRYQFEDLISDYIENKLPIAKRKKLEAFMEANPEAKDQLESIRSLMKSMKRLPEVKTSDEFTEKLMKQVEFEKNRPSAKKYVTSTVGKTYTGVKPKYVLPTVLVTYFLAEGRFFSNSTRFINFSVNSSEVFTSGSLFMDFINERIDSN